MKKKFPLGQKHYFVLSGSVRYEILAGLPAYGEMYIPVSEDEHSFYSEGFPVRFFKKDGTDWVANFDLGFTEMKEIHQLANFKNIIVISGGICFIMNPEYTKPVSVFGASYETSLVTVDGRLILQDLTGLTIFENDGNYWHSERIALDGIKDIRVDGNIVSGCAYNGREEWEMFRFNIDTRNLKFEGR